MMAPFENAAERRGVASLTLVPVSTSSLSLVVVISRVGGLAVGGSCELGLVGDLKTV